MFCLFKLIDNKTIFLILNLQKVFQLFPFTLNTTLARWMKGLYNENMRRSSLLASFAVLINFSSNYSGLSMYFNNVYRLFQMSTIEFKSALYWIYTECLHTLVETSISPVSFLDFIYQIKHLIFLINCIVLCNTQRIM